MTERELDEAVAAGNVAALREEIERLSEKLSDCWLLLDYFARCGVAPISSQAVQLLTRQEAPGWKPRPIKERL